MARRSMIAAVVLTVMAVRVTVPVDAWAYRDVRVPFEAEPAAGTPAGTPRVSPATTRATSALQATAAPTNLRVNDPAQVPANSNEITPAIGVIGDRVLIVWRVTGVAPTERLRASISEDGGATYTDVGWLPGLSGDWRWGIDPCVESDPQTNTFFIAAQCANPSLTKQGIAFVTAQIGTGIHWGTPSIVRETTYGGFYWGDRLDMHFDPTYASLDLVFHDGFASPQALTHQVSWDRGASWSMPTMLVSDAEGGKGLAPRVAWNSFFGPIVSWWNMDEWDRGELNTRRSVVPTFDPTVPIDRFRVDNGSLPGTPGDRTGGTSIACDRTFYRFQGKLYTAWVASCSFPAPPTPSGASIAENEPNDTPAQANPIVGTGWMSGAFSPANDLDCMSIALDAGQRLVVQATNIVSAGNPLVEPTVQVEVVAPDGTHTLGSTALPIGHLAQADLLFTAPRAATYTLRVTGVNVVSYQLSFVFPASVSLGLDRRDIYTSFSTDGGHSWSYPSLLYTGPPGFDVANVRMIVANDGRPYVFWQDWSEVDPDGAIMTVHATRSSDGGSIWETPRTLSTAASDWQLVGGGFELGWRLGAATSPMVLGESVPPDEARPMRTQPPPPPTPEERVHVAWTDARLGQGDVFTASFPTTFEVLYRTTDTTATPGEVLGLRAVLQNRNTVFPLWINPDPPSCTRNWASIAGSMIMDPGQTVSTYPIAVFVPDTAAVGTVFFQGSLNTGPESYGINTFIHVLPKVAGVEAADHGLDFAAPGPNPASSVTGFRFRLPESANVAVELFDVSGAGVRTLVSGRVEAGVHARGWDLRDDGGREVPAGVYLARMTVGGWSRTRRVAVVH